MRLIIGMGFFALVVGYALWRGGGPERWVAGILLAMLVLDRAGHLVLGYGSSPAIDGLHLFIDSAGFVGMMMAMIRTRRLWPIWACSFQLLSLASYVTQVLSAQLPPIVPAILAIAPNYLICVSLMVGTILHQVRLRRRGSDPSWRSSLPRAAGPTRRSTRTSF